MRALFIIVVALAFSAQAQEWRGHVSAEYRGFAHAGLDADQHRGYASLVAQPEFRGAWQDRQQQLTFTGFYRWDQHDRQRTPRKDARCRPTRSGAQEYRRMPTLRMSPSAMAEPSSEEPP